MNVDPDGAEVRRLLSRLPLDDRPTEAERERMRRSVASATTAGPDARVDAGPSVGDDLEVVEWAPARPARTRRRSVLAPLAAAAGVLLLAGFAAALVSVARTETPPLAEPRVEVELGGVAVSFAFTEPATLDELADDVISYRATDYVSPFGEAGAGGRSTVTVARPRELFDGLPPEEFFASNGLEVYPAPAIVEDVRVPAWNVVVPTAERDRRGCVSAGPCVPFAELANGTTLDLDAGLIGRVVVVPIGDGPDLVVFMSHVGPPQGSSQDALSRLRDQILAGLTVG